MAAANERSTEKLLNLIRQDEGGGQQPPMGNPAKGKVPKGKPPKRGKAPKVKAKVPSSSKGSNFIGVDIGSEGLRLVKATKAGSTRRLADAQYFPYDPGVSPDSPTFSDFLARSIKQFARNYKSCEIWTHISTTKTELWHIRIPKVPKNQIIEAVTWSVKKEKQYEEREFVLDFELQGEVIEKGVPKLSVLVYLVPRQQSEEVQAIFNKAGISLTGLTVAPIAIQTMFRCNWIPGTTKTYAHLNVGRNWSRIDIFDNGDLVLSRGIKAGTNSMIEALMDNYNMSKGGGGATSEPNFDEPVISLSLDEDSPVMQETRVADGTAAAPGERVQNLDFEQARRVLWSKLIGGSLAPGEPGAELSEMETLKMIRPAAERLIRQVERTFEFHTTTMGNERVELIYFSGELAANQTLVKYIHSQLGIGCQVLDPMAPEIGGAARLSGQYSLSERIAYCTSLALSLSDNVITPNLLYTYHDKEKARKAQKLSQATMILFILVLLVLGGLWFALQQAIDAKRQELAEQTQYLTKFTPNVTIELLSKKGNELKEKREREKMASYIYEGLAIIGEVSSLTPDHIKLVKYDMNLGPVSRLDIISGTGPVQGETRVLVLDGIITGEEDQFDSSLVSYLLRLQNSPLFGTPILEKNDKEDYESEGRVLRFNIRLEVL